VFFYQIGRTWVNWGLLYTSIFMRKRLCVHYFFQIILPLAKWSLTKGITININKFLGIYYVHKQSFSSLSISIIILWKHQIPYMNIVSKSTPIMRFNLDNSVGQQRALCNALAVGGR
jgi:hypothetical protein